MGSILNFVFEKPNTNNVFDHESYNGNGTDIFHTSAVNGYIKHSIFNDKKYSYTVNYKLATNSLNLLVYECLSELSDILKNKDTKKINYQDCYLLDIVKKVDIKSNNIKIVIASISEPTFNIHLFENHFVEFCQINNLDINKFIFIDSNFRITELNKIKWKYVAHFIYEGARIAKEITDYPGSHINELRYSPSIVKLEDARNKLDRPYSFISLNRSNWKIHRTLLGCFFLENNLSNIKWSFLTKPNDAHRRNDSKTMEYDAEANDYVRDIFYKNITELETIYPKEIDTFNISEKNGFRTSDTFNEDISLDCYFDIVTESVFERNAIFFTEKIIKPIINLQPFIVISSKHYLKYFKDTFGFKTFDCIFDESYDNIDDSFERFEFISKQILEISKKSKEELSSMYERAFSICEYNRNLLLEKYSNTNEHMINLIKEIENEW